MNPLAAGLRQPDQRTCGAATVAMAQALRDPSYAERVRDQAAFGREVRDRHRTLTSLRPDGGWQVPWPRALGTPPWAVARALTDLTGHRHRVRLVRLGGLGRGAGALWPSSALYLGDRWLPRHVVLVVPGPETGDARVHVYDPGRGRVVAVTDFKRWTTPWFVVAPDGFAPTGAG